jgi:hypothetical protein
MKNFGYNVIISEHKYQKFTPVTNLKKKIIRRQ